MSKYTYEDYIKNDCHPVGFNEACESYYFAQSTVDNLLDRVCSLEEQLKNSITSKFKTYQPVFYITKYYTSTRGGAKFDIVCDKYYVAENENEIILGWNYAKDFSQRKYFYVRKDWVFATREDAETRLAELKGETK